MRQNNKANYVSNVIYTKPIIKLFYFYNLDFVFLDNNFYKTILFKFEKAQLSSTLYDQKIILNLVE